ncbi:MAG: protein kinase [Calditrichota bacterium]
MSHFINKTNPMDIQFPNYRIEQELGRGSFGVVYKAWQESLQRFVAIKVLSGQLTNDQALKKRFLFEARLAGTLSHENLAVVHDCGETKDGVPYIVMEYVDGVNLRSVIAGPYKLEEKIRLAIQICRGLFVVHQHKIVHRDIKPANIMLRNDGIIKIMDFGIAKALTPELQNNLTMGTQGALGTVSYMSPEQTRGEAIDHRSDIFSFGVLLYELVSSMKPFKGEALYTRFHSIQNDSPIELSESYLENWPQLWDIILHCLEKDPVKRYQDMRQVCEDLEKLLASTGDYIVDGKKYHFNPVDDLTVLADEKSSSTAATDHHSEATGGSTTSNTIWMMVAAALFITFTLGGWFYFSGTNANPVLESDAVSAMEELLQEPSLGEPEQAVENSSLMEQRSRTRSLTIEKNESVKKQPDPTKQTAAKKTIPVKKADVEKTSESARPSQAQLAADSWAQDALNVRSTLSDMHFYTSMSTDIAAVDKLIETADQSKGSQPQRAQTLYKSAIVRMKSLKQLDIDLQASEQDFAAGRYSAVINRLEGLTAESDAVTELLQKSRSAQQRLEQQLDDALASGKSGRIAEGLATLRELPAVEQRLTIVQSAESQLLGYDRSAPAIQYEKLKKYDHRKSLTFQATVRDDVALENVSLFLKLDDDVSFQRNRLTPDGSGTVVLFVDPDRHQGRSIEYYWEAVDLSGNVGREGSADNPIKLSRKQKHFIPRAP